ncbi:hypothetical protein LTR91_018775 [Friedmanniomyces endolithicus]|uniref:Uncharacterized protein n=1 Tax=Friedmanniomyces endolithicus TaxID=329885 RepID=A0AAN6HC03_9PEZI|nr:hypothetical protein LTR94_008833 [Friedmanniomyces endolithicus]KAK0802225.1 hypothetical protein LTR38_006542 [Friedmanniomyces endolithicus]KAK0804021.1 hypothetical protein LTR59_004467 [Friedmanniomyces endolithicus]KAK0819044.1 hypothetical protein LTR75_002248 [Friedmanniomyces endolithicus]KAK0851692.1 hypothetical protein LTR03_003949 [Friedmanniomyces endolithicus]
MSSIDSIVKRKATRISLGTYSNYHSIAGDFSDPEPTFFEIKDNEMTRLPALRRKPAVRDLRIAADILSLVRSHPRHPVMCGPVGPTDECLTADKDLASLVPLPLFHGRSYAQRGGRADRITDVAAKGAKQRPVNWNGLVSFPDYDEAYATELLQQLFDAELSWRTPGSSVSRRRVAEQGTSYQSGSRPSGSRSECSHTSSSHTQSLQIPTPATQQVHEAGIIAGAECDYGELSPSLSTPSIVNNIEGLHNDETDMLRTLHGFPYDVRCRPCTSRKPDQAFWKSCARAVKCSVRRMMRM